MLNINIEIVEATSRLIMTMSIIHRFFRVCKVSTFDYVHIPPRIDLEPRLIIRKPITSPVLSPLSYKFIVLGLLIPYPIPFRFGLQFVTLQ